MPQLIGVKLLSQTCLNLITNKMASMCENTSSTATTNNTTNQSYFDQLPSKFLEEMISTLQTKGCLKQFLSLLAAPQLGTLYLEVLSKEEYSVHFVNSLRCVYLRNLHLRSSVHINDIFLTSIIPTFAKLQVLVISNSSAGDKSLKVIGTCCRYLRELEIIDCKNITDFGVGMLCVNSARNLGREGDELGLHKSLLKLSSSGTKITNTGIRLGLETFHSLIVWDMVTGNFLAEIHEEDFLNPSSEIQNLYSLMHLGFTCNYRFYPEFFGLVLSLCPFVIELEIDIEAGMGDSEMRCLLSLVKLRELKLGGKFIHSNVTFHGGVIPILKKFGNSSLKTLSLSGSIHHVNIPVITQLCPNLQCFHLLGMQIYSDEKFNEEGFKTESPILKKLEKLRIHGYYSYNYGYGSELNLFPRQHLILLLSAPQLLDIAIVYCFTLTDDVLQEAARLQKFHYLENFELTECHNVTEKGIDIFMNAQNTLKKITLRMCRQITKSNIECWKKQAEMNHWQLLIEFEQYDDDADDQ